ncbi:hypothetical protein DPX16_13583 [Anabarilius grahami]|uniref:Uncharacterized protein n=1 Tax=Anabarilius grahami TaxID=495550 RepID=A0A3N0XRE9_ANAGA|nr:hypothetical protein DPX16_13583 [Anabarilius grahami]
MFYLMEYLNICHQVTCDDVTLMEGFWCGLDKDIRFLMPKGETCWSLEDYINFALWMDGSSFTIGKAGEKNIAIVQPYPTSIVTSLNPEPSQPSPP